MRACAQGVTTRQTDRQTDRRERSAAAAAPTTTNACVKPEDKVNMTVLKDWIIPRQEVQNDAMHDRGPERRDGRSNE